MEVKLKNEQCYANIQKNTITNYFRDCENQKSHTRARRKKANDETIYKNVYCAFDIETSRLDNLKQSFMYIWQFAFGHNGNVHLITGRTWEQFIELLDMINDSLNDNECVMVYVHNLSYEFTFLSGVLHFETDNVFCTDRRKVLKAKYKKIEFRCSYILTNMSLSMFTEQMNCDHKKLSGEEFNYNVVRYPWTELTEREYQYCVNDVIGLVESLNIFFQIEHDDYYSIPLTSTGFVRRDMKKSIANGVSHKYMVDIQPCYELFLALREAFRGGDTHANRWLVDNVLTTVYSEDRSSSYPDVICNRLFPVKKFQNFGALTIDEFEKKLEHKYALLIRCEITGIELRDDRWGFPYLPISKCRGIKESDCVMDNGRIVQTDKTFNITITDVDFAIIDSQYIIGEIIFLEVWGSQYGELPKAVKNVVIDYYKKKTEWKNIPNLELVYGKAKNKLNACYGMMVQDVTKVSTLYEEGRMDNNEQLNEFFEDTSKTPMELLEKYSQKGFLPYQWGVWVTAWARYELQCGLNLCDPLQCVYCDTDSIKHLDKIDLTKYNNRCIENSKRNGAYATDKDGITHYMGVFETETTSDKFITQGAKKYCCEINGHLKLTCAGVLKKEGAKELETAGGIDKFRDAFVFEKAGGTGSIYNDDVDMLIDIDGHSLHITKNVYLYDDIYTLGKTGEYLALLDFCHKTIDFVIKGDKIVINTETVNQKKKRGKRK